MRREPTSAISLEEAPSSGLQLVDADVHPMSAAGLASVLSYMPEAWRRRFEMKGTAQAAIPLTFRFAHPGGHVLRPDAAPPSGGIPGSDPAHVVTDHLDRWSVDIAVLIAVQPAAMASVLAGPDESGVICAAFNDFFLAEWASIDPRFRLAVTVPSQDPVAAAAEVRRLGAHKAVCAVFVPLIDRPLGNRHYQPIYEAASEFGLPIVTHATGTEHIYHGAPSSGIGFVEGYAERYALFPQIAQSNIASLVFGGILARFPTLKFVFLEYAFSWLVPFLWRLDKAWEGCRLETPWVTERPSEYVARQVRLSTQPLDEPKAPRDLSTLVDMIDPRVLLFSSDYPHWDGDSPTHAFRTSSRELRQRIFADNGVETFRL